MTAGGLTHFSVPNLGLSKPLDLLFSQESSGFRVGSKRLWIYSRIAKAPDLQFDQ